MSSSASSASVEAGKADETPAALEEFVTLVVTDEEGRRLTRTTRRTDNLQVLMDYYYSMVPTVKHSEGVFIYRHRRLSGDATHRRNTPAHYKMEDGDKISFFPEIELVTPVLEDFAGRSFTFTMGATDELQDLMDYYHAMVPASPAVAPVIFFYRGKRVTGEQTPAGIRMKDWDRIYVVPTERGAVGREKNPDVYITLKVRDLNGHNVYRTMRQTEKLEVLMSFYYAILPAAAVLGGTFVNGANGRRLCGDETPAQLGMKEGDGLEHFATMWGG